MKVSVLIPVYNGARNLRECLDSILAQRFADMEILVSDDASADESLSVVEQYAAKEPRLRWWKNSSRLGLTGNFNRCLQAARGDYVKFVLQDDKLMSPDTITRMTAQLDDNPGVSLVASATVLMDEQSRTTGYRSHFRAGVTPGTQAIRRCLEEPGNLIGEPTVVMFRREDAGRGFDERFRQLVDYEMWIHLLGRGNFAYFAEYLCAFRRHPRQATETNRHEVPDGYEEMMLLSGCVGQPWFKDVVTPRLLFANVHWHRKRPDNDVLQNLRRQLGGLRYGLGWLNHKLIRPLKRRRGQATAGPK